MGLAIYESRRNRCARKSDHSMFLRVGSNAESMQAASVFSTSNAPLGTPARLSTRTLPTLQHVQGCVFRSHSKFHQCVAEGRNRNAYGHFAALLLHIATFNDRKAAGQSDLG